jgi:hypothetical protein
LLTDAAAHTAATIAAENFMVVVDDEEEGTKEPIGMSEHAAQ